MAAAAATNTLTAPFQNANTSVHVALLQRSRLALANPDPEISYPDAVAARSDVIMATGRSDYPNQINNVLAFPGIFRGALDAGARDITENMKLAAAQAIAESVSEDELCPDFVVPSVFDTSVVQRVAPAVAAAAVADGVVRNHA